MSVFVRDAVSDDAAALVLVLHELGYDRTLKEVLLGLSSPGQTVLVADEAGVISGLLVLVLRHQLHLGATIASIDALVVERGARSKGVGAMLLKEAVARATHAGALRVELHSNLKRQDAHRFYERHGFFFTSKYFVKELGGNAKRALAAQESDSSSEA